MEEESRVIITMSLEPWVIYILIVVGIVMTIDTLMGIWSWFAHRALKKGALPFGYIEVTLLDEKDKPKKTICNVRGIQLVDHIESEILLERGYKSKITTLTGATFYVTEAPEEIGTRVKIAMELFKGED